MLHLNPFFRLRAHTLVTFLSTFMRYIGRRTFSETNHEKIAINSLVGDKKAIIKGRRAAIILCSGRSSSLQAGEEMGGAKKHRVWGTGDD